MKRGDGKNVQFEGFDREKCWKLSSSAQQTQRRNRKVKENQEITQKKGQKQQNSSRVNKHHAEMASIKFS